MLDELPIQLLHGIRVITPPTWEDASLYRFLGPVEEEQGMLTVKSPQQLQPTVVIAQLRLRPDDPPEAFFETSNRARKEGDETFEVKDGGELIYLDQPARWQDTTFKEPTHGAQVYQRTLVLKAVQEHFTEIVITGTKKDVGRMSTEMGINLAVSSDAEPVGEGVDAVLVAEQGEGEEG